MNIKTTIKRLACLALPLCMLMGCASGQAPQLLEPAKVQSDIETAYIGEIFNVVMYEASIEPQVNGQSFASGGSVSSLNVTLGDRVTSGQELASLDMSEISAQRDELAALIEQKVTNHQFEMERLEAQKDIAYLEYSQAQAQLEAELLSLQGQQAEQLFAIELSELEAQLEALDRALENDKLTASCSGTVVKMSVQPGGTVRAGTDCVYIADDDTKVITCQYIPTAEIEECDRVYASIGGVEYDVSYVQYSREEYLQLAITGGEMSSTFEIIQPDENIQNGMFTCVYLVSDYVPDALIVPANAVHSDGEGSYLYLAQGDEQVKRYIETGVVTQAQVQVLSGIEEGDEFYVAS